MPGTFRRPFAEATTAQLLCALLSATFVETPASSRRSAAGNGRTPQDRSQGGLALEPHRDRSAGSEVQNTATQQGGVGDGQGAQESVGTGIKAGHGAQYSNEAEYSNGAEYPKGADDSEGAEYSKGADENKGAEYSTGADSWEGQGGQEGIGGSGGGEVPILAPHACGAVAFAAQTMIRLCRRGHAGGWLGLRYVHLCYYSTLVYAGIHESTPALGTDCFVANSS